jgi:hypothetical protein
LQGYVVWLPFASGHHTRIYLKIESVFEDIDWGGSSADGLPWPGRRSIIILCLNFKMVIEILRDYERSAVKL